MPFRIYLVSPLQPGLISWGSFLPSHQLRSSLQKMPQSQAIALQGGHTGAPSDGPAGLISCSDLGSLPLRGPVWHHVLQTRTFMSAEGQP